jgi:hypothetical protein
VIGTAIGIWVYDVDFYTQYDYTIERIEEYGTYLSDESPDAIDWRSYGNTSLIAASSSPEGVRIYDANNNFALIQVILSGNSQGVTLSPDLTRISVGNPDLQVAQIWDIVTATLISSYSMDKISLTREIGWNPNANLLAYGDDGDMGLYVVCASSSELPADRSAPVLQQPCGDTQEGHPPFRWWAVPGAEWYELYITAIPNHSSRPFTQYNSWRRADEVCSGDICQIQLDYALVMLRNADYTWAVRSYDSDSQTFSGWVTMDFTVNAPPPAIVPQISISPMIYDLADTNPAQSNYQSVTLTWQDVPNTEYYHLSIYGGSHFLWWPQNPVGNTIYYEIDRDAACTSGICTYTMDYVQISSSDAGVAYWFVRGFGPGGFFDESGGWGSGQAFTIEVIPTQQLLAGAEGSDNVAPTLPESDTAITDGEAISPFPLSSCEGITGCEAPPVQIAPEE